MEVLQTISWSPDVASLAAIFFLPVWGLLSGLWLIAGGWYRIARPRLEPGTKHIRSPVMRGAMALGTALTIILLQVGRLSRTLMAPFFRRRTPTAARRSLW
jgi:hypothetical protein